MKKLLLILTLFLFTLPIFSQTVYFTENNRERLMKRFFSVDTIQKDSIYTIQYTLYINGLIDYVDPFGHWNYRHNWYRNHWKYSSYFWYYNDWFYDNYYWFYHHNWYYNNYLGWNSNYYRYYHRHYWNYYNDYRYHKQKPIKSYRQRTISTRTVRPDIKREINRVTNHKYIRPRTAVSNKRYNRPTREQNVVKRTSTYRKPERKYDERNTYVRSRRQSSTYSSNRNNNRSYNKSYNRPSRSGSQRNSATRNSGRSSSRSSSGSRSGGRR